MKLVGMERPTEQNIIGYVEDHGQYKSFQLSSQDVFTLSHGADEVLPKDRFTNYAHFRDMMGKWDPYVFFFKRPRTIPVPITYEWMREQAKDLFGDEE